MRVRVKISLIRRGRQQLTAIEQELVGADNAGFLLQTEDGATPRTVFNEWNAAQIPGRRLNPFYLDITEEKLGST